MRLDFADSLYVGSTEVSKVYLGSSLVYTGSIITYIGRENETEAGNYAVTNWSATANAKKFNVGDLEKYGTSGYYQLRPGSVDISEAASAGNNLGISAGTSPTLYSAPSFATVTGGAGSFVNFSGYSTFRNFADTAGLRQGALSVSVSNGPFSITPPDGVAVSARFGEAYTITLTENADFILGIAVNAIGTGQYSPNYVGVYTPAAGTVVSALISRANSTPRMPFFLIRGTSGQVFTVAMWQLESDPTWGAPSVAASSLLTFDRLA